MDSLPRGSHSHSRQTDRHDQHDTSAVGNRNLKAPNQWQLPETLSPSDRYFSLPLLHLIYLLPLLPFHPGPLLLDCCLYKSVVHATSISPISH